jgi:hypothetical protein
LIIARSPRGAFLSVEEIENEDEFENEHDSVRGSDSQKPEALEYGHLFNYHSLALAG